MSPRLSSLILVLVFAAWLASFFLPTVETAQETLAGWQIALIGWYGVLILQFGWLANLIIIPALGLAAGQYGDAPRARAIVGAVLSLLVINSAFWSNIPVDAGENPITRYREGYWLWMASMSAVSFLLIAEPLKGRKVRSRSGRTPADQNDNGGIDGR